MPTPADLMRRARAFPARVLAWIVALIALTGAGFWFLTPETSAPKDGRGWALLAYTQMESGEHAAAAASFEQAISASRKVAADPGLWCDYAEALGLAQGGTMAGRPTEALQRALALRGDHPKALEMAGSAAYERGDYARAASYWRALLPQLADGSALQAALRGAIERAERQAAVALR